MKNFPNVILIFSKSPVLKNILGIGLSRFLGIFTNFLLIGVIYRYFGNEELNGIWLTVSSVLTWITFFDFGMGNSLRNKLTESILKKDYEASNKYISTTYILMLIPTVIVVFIGAIIAFTIDWIGIFNISSIEISEEYLSIFIFTVITLFSFNFYFSLVYAVFHALYKSYIISVMQLCTNIVNILIILLLMFLGINDLIILGNIYISTSIIILIISTIYIFKLKKNNLSFSVRFFYKPYIKDIFSVGIKFLILQLAIIVLFNTDNFLISKFLGAQHVTTYELTYKLMSINTILLGIVLTPIWTKVIRDSSMNNVKELKNTFLKLFKFYLLLILSVILMGFLTPFIMKIWTGDHLNIAKSLILFMMVFTIIHMWCNIFQNILNGLNKLRIQMYCYGIATIINIPVSIFLIQNTTLGVTAIIIGTIISLCIPAIILPIYTFNFIKKLDNSFL
nr:oligosaccharide flippase family protein [Lysinibacillus timonensis]